MLLDEIILLMFLKKLYIKFRTILNVIYNLILFFLNNLVKKIEK